MAKVNKNKRLSKLAREFNVGISTIVDFLNKKGIEIDSNPNTKVSDDAYDILAKEYSSDLNLKKESEKVNLKSTREKKETVSIDPKSEEGTKEATVEKTEEEAPAKNPVKVVGKIDLDALKPKAKQEKPEKRR